MFTVKEMKEYIDEITTDETDDAVRELWMKLSCTDWLRRKTFIASFGFVGFNQRSRASIIVDIISVKMQARHADDCYGCDIRNLLSRLQETDSLNDAVDYIAFMRGQDELNVVFESVG